MPSTAPEEAWWAASSASNASESSASPPSSSRCCATRRGQLHGPYYWIVLGLFVFIGVGFSAIKLPQEIRVLSEIEDRDAAERRVEGTPAEELARELRPDERVDPPPLTRRPWVNVALVVLYSQFLQVALVSAMVFVFLLVFGGLVVTEPVARGFVDAPPHVLASLDLWAATW